MNRFEAQYVFGNPLDKTMALFKDIVQVFNLYDFNQLSCEVVGTLCTMFAKLSNKRLQEAGIIALRVEQRFQFLDAFREKWPFCHCHLSAFEPPLAILSNA
ncbi:hypothetical protein [Pseudochrobactrum kiredjianiae]|uniref:NR LBD domain-containing protein n=1 Tax=Pseudochrobactrum kiredjianiae TaxID=386305 RepID=A0ABW3UYC0_9HYPH|nr:hypothetical protein [Pseudochrobactrum kiredjianiae]